MSKDEVLKLALEAIQYREGGWSQFNPVIAAIQEVLAEQPARLDPSAGTQVSKVWWDGDKLMAQPIPLTSLYKQPAQQQEFECPRCGHCCHEQQRKPLTRSEISARIARQVSKVEEDQFVLFARAIEAAHGIKGDA